MEMVERVARAICEANGDDWDREGVDGLADSYVPLARAAIEAMRGPTDDMLDAFMAEGQRQGVAFDEWSPPMFPKLMWQAMIESALIPHVNTAHQPPSTVNETQAKAGTDSE